MFDVMPDIDLERPESQVIPGDLDEWEPGPFLAVVLSGIDTSKLSDYDLIVVLRARQRMASHYQAQTYETMSQVEDAMARRDDEPNLIFDGAVAEVRAALRLTRRSAEYEMTLADGLRRLPQVRHALSKGHIDLRRARALVAETTHLTENEAMQVATRILPHAPHLTTGQIKARCRTFALEVDPESAKSRYEEQVEERRVTSELTEFCTANIFGLDLPPHLVAAAMDRINQMAEGLKTGEETRTMDQLRSDVFLDLLLGRRIKGEHRYNGRVEAKATLDTLLGLADRPGELAGYGPVVADIARQVAEHSTDAPWRYLVTDPDTGTLVDAGTTRRRPTAAQRRFVEARDQTCIFPGCRTPASRSDLDHNPAWEEAHRTRVDDLSAACPHDHTIHHTGWTYQRGPDGIITWTSRLGHEYQVKPPHLEYKPIQPPDDDGEPP